MNDLDKEIKTHYQQQRLSDSALDRIITLGEAAKHDKSRAYFTKLKTANWRTVSAMFAASIIFGITFGITFGLSGGQNNALQASVTQLVLEEIAMNHNKRLAVEYPIDKYEPLRTAMARLDFGLSRPDSLPENYRLIGGRYCSIQGKIAAQLKVKDVNNGQIATLYITPMTQRLMELSTQQSVQDNVDIQLWQADNLLYGLATSQE